MKKARYLVLVLFGALAMQSTAMAAQWKCGDIANAYQSYWTGSTYTIGWTSTCTVTQANKQGFKSLHEFFLARLTQVGTVKSGPSSIKVKGLTGQQWTMEDRFTQNGDKMVAINTTQIGTDSKSRLVSATTSSSVKGSGNSKYVTYLDSIVDVTSKDGKTFKVVFAGNIQLKKPLLVPSNMFANGAEQGTASAFVDTRNELIQKIAGSL